MRVLVQKPAIFILDEATASIDPFTEWQIQQALEPDPGKHHQHPDRPPALDRQGGRPDHRAERGKIIEEGNHDSLLERGGHYASLYNTYFRHQSLDYIEESRNLIQKQELQDPHPSHD